MNILDYIGFGKDNAVTRDQLCARTNLSDRVVRKLIEIARIEGAVIINEQDGAGYYISEDPKDIRRQMVTNHNRAMSILRQQRLLRRKLREIEGADQISIEEAAHG
jgi:DNA-binding transcriptional regulator LsrR (DeoR family)